MINVGVRSEVTPPNRRSIQIPTKLDQTEKNCLRQF